jgi:hypothetical protein
VKRAARRAKGARRPATACAWRVPAIKWAQEMGPGVTFPWRRRGLGAVRELTAMWGKTRLGVVTALLLAGCTSASLRNGVPESLAGRAEIPGMAEVRTRGDGGADAVAAFFKEKGAKLKAKYAARSANGRVPTATCWRSPAAVTTARSPPGCWSAGARMATALNSTSSPAFPRGP